MGEITILGTGAMAMLFGGWLARAGIKIRLLGTWQECIQEINQRGICVVKAGTPQYYPAQADSNPTSFSETKLALVLVKSWQTERAANQLKEFLAADGVALTLQNGLGNEQLLKKTLGQERIAVGVTTYGATVLGPGRVRPGGQGMITVGDHPRLSPMINLLQGAGLSLQQVYDLSGLIWGKLIINVAINPLTALLGVNNGKLLESSTVTQLMGLAAQEAATVAQKQGISLDITDPKRSAETVAAATGSNISSMLQDIQRGAPTEIDALCGEVVRKGKQLAVPTPVNEILMMLVQGKVDLQRIEG